MIGSKDVPIEYAKRGEDEEGGAAAGKEAAAEDQGPVPIGVPEFWLGAMRAHPLISEHVSLASLLTLSCAEASNAAHINAPRWSGDYHMQQICRRSCSEKNLSSGKTCCVYFGSHIVQPFESLSF